MSSGTGGLVAALPILVGVSVTAIVLIASYRSMYKRRARAKAFAAQRGWTYMAHAPALRSRWSCPPFNVGSSRRVDDALIGDFHGRNVVSFHYEYTTGGGKSRSTHRFHIVSMQLPAELPWLRLSPDRAGAAMARFFGGQDIEFESHAFNEAWRVQAPPGQYAFDFIHPRMMDRLLQADAVGHRISVEGQDILLVAPGKQRLEAIDHHANLLYGIVDLIPRHLWLKVGHDPLA